jgi:hypothetical protein
MKDISVDECISVLEVAIGEAESILPEAVLRKTIEYLKVCKQIQGRNGYSFDDYDRGYR